MLAVLSCHSVLFVNYVALQGIGAYIKNEWFNTRQYVDIAQCIYSGSFVDLLVDDQT